MSIESAMKGLQRRREALVADKTDLERQAKAIEDDIAVSHRAMKLLDPSVAERKPRSFHRRAPPSARRSAGRS